MKDNEIFGAEGIVIHGDKIVLGMQSSSRWYTLNNGKTAAILKTIGGAVEKQDKNNTRNTLIRELLEEIKGINIEDIKISENIIFTKEIKMKDINPYEINSNLKMKADFYIVNIPSNVCLSPNDLPVLVEIPIDKLLNMEFSTDYSLKNISNFLIKKKEKLKIPDNYAIMAPKEMKQYLNNNCDKKNKERIAFDFDGVIANTTLKKHEWLKNINISLDNVDKTSIYEELSKTYSKEKIDDIYMKMSKEIFTERVLLETEAIEGAINTLKKLSEVYDIYIITARTQTLILQVEKWLKKNNLKESITKIISSSFKNKQDICIDNNITFLCDDDIRHLKETKVKNRVLFKNEKSLKFEDYGIKSVNSWEEVEKILI